MSHGSTLTGFPGNCSVFISCKDHERYRQDFPSYTTCSQLEMAIKVPFLNGCFRIFQRKGFKPLQISKLNNKTPKATKTAILWIWKCACWGWMGRISPTSMAWMETNSKQILKVWPRQYMMFSNAGSCGCCWSLEGSTLSWISAGWQVYVFNRAFNVLSAVQNHLCKALLGHVSEKEEQNVPVQGVQSNNISPLR